MRLSRFLNQLLILAADEWRNILYRKRALFSLVFYSVAILLLVLGIIKLERFVTAKLTGLGDVSAARSMLEQQIQSLGYGREYHSLLSLGSLPASIVAVQFLCLLFYPTIVSLISCDSIASDIHRGTIRFLLTRTGRATYFIAKSFAHFLLYVGLYGLTMLSVFLACAYSAHDFYLPLYVQSALLYFAVFVPFLWLLTAMTLLLSCSARRPAQVIIRLHLLWLLFALLAYFYPAASPFRQEMVLGLIVPRSAVGSTSALAFCGWAFGLTLLGLFTIKRRSL